MKWVHIYGICTLEDLPRLVFINEKCGNLKVVAGDEELFVSIKKKKKADVLQAYRLSLCDKCYRQDCFLISMWNIANPSGKPYCSCG